MTTSLVQQKTWDNMQRLQERKGETWERMGVAQWDVGGKPERIL